VSGARAERTVAGLHDFLEREVLPGVARGAALDLGCGTGAWLERLRRAGFRELTGIDNAEDPQVDGARFLRCDLDRAMPAIEAGAFDLVTAIEVVEHLENPGALLSLAQRALAPDGVLVLTSPNIHALRSRVRRGELPSFDAKSDPTHIAPLLLPAFEKIALRHGLSIASARTYPPRGSRVFGAPVRMLAAVLRPLVGDSLPGDTLCLVLRRAP
jgi:SAM-dependent methyltransferase